MKTQWTCLCCLAFIVAASASGVAQDEFPKQAGLRAQHGISIIPEPQIARVTGDDFLVNSATFVHVSSGAQDARPSTSLLGGVAEITGLKLRRAEVKPKTNVIALVLVPESELAGVPEGTARKEAYNLEVTRKEVRIRAAQPAGLFYGVQTLLQLLEQGRGKVRGLSITDWPEMEFRAIHVDLWYHLDRPWYYHHLFRQLAHYKINTAVFEFEYKFQYTKHPALSAPGALSQADVRRLVETARQHYIEIVPLLSHRRR